MAAAIAAAEDQLANGSARVSRQSVAVAGHSVGELAAGVLAGVISSDDAMRLVRVRANGMAAAAAAEATGMTAVLGGDEDGAGRDRGVRAHAGQRQRRGPDRGRRHARAAGRVRREPAGRRQAAPALGGRRIPYPPHGARCRRAAPRPLDRPRGRPAPAAAVQPGRRGGQVRPRLAGADHHPGQRAGPVGPVHADHGRRWASPR